VRLGEFNADTDLDCSDQLGCSKALDFKIEKIIPHTGYGVGEKSHDIELIKIKGNIPFNTPFVKPICLPFEEEYGIKGQVKPNVEDQFPSRKGVVAGWGRTQWSMRFLITIFNCP